MSRVNTSMRRVSVKKGAARDAESWKRSVCSYTGVTFTRETKQSHNVAHLPLKTRQSCGLENCCSQCEIPITGASAALRAGGLCLGMWLCVCVCMRVWLCVVVRVQVRVRVGVGLGVGACGCVSACM